MPPAERAALYAEHEQTTIAGDPWCLRCQSRCQVLPLLDEIKRLEDELSLLRPVAQAASDADWHFRQHGRGRLRDADYVVLWCLRDALEPLRQDAETLT